MGERPLNVSQVFHILQQPIAITKIVNSTVGIPILVIPTLTANDHVYYPLSLKEHFGFIARLKRGEQLWCCVGQQFRLYVKTADKTNLFGSGTEGEQ